MNFSDMLMMCYLSSHCGFSRDFMCCVYNASLFPQALMTARSREPVCIKSGVCWSWSLSLQVTPTLGALLFMECLFENYWSCTTIHQWRDSSSIVLPYDSFLGPQKVFGGKFLAFKVSVNCNGPHTFFFEKYLSCMAIILMNRWGKIKQEETQG